MIRTCELDTNQPPLYPIVAPNPLTVPPQLRMIDPLLHKHWDPNDAWASLRAEFLTLKSPLVLQMLGTRMGKGLLQKAIGKLCLSALSGELPSGISTHHFLKVARKVSGKMELKQFADQWIYGSGCPRFLFRYHFNRKKMVIEFRFRQENTNAGSLGCTPKFTGPFTIRVHEPNGTFDTEVTLEDIEKQFDIQYHTKYKRIRRKPFPARRGTAARPDGDGAAAPEEEEEEPEGDDAIGEWKGDEPERLTFDWIRLDPDHEWISSISFEQPDFMWAAQLKKDREVMAQCDALEALYRLPSSATSSLLAGAVADVSLYYRLRMQAAHGLARCATEEFDWAGLRQLMRIYREAHCYSDRPGSSIPRSNDFSNLQEYFVQMSIVQAIATVRGQNGACPMDCRRFLIDLLKFNDNRGNEYSDNYFVAGLITSIGKTFGPSPRPPARPAPPPPVAPRALAAPNAGAVEEFGVQADSDDEDESNRADGRLASEEERALFAEALEEVRRRMRLDNVVPTYHNTVTVACLKTQMWWMLAKLIPTNIDLFLDHTLYGHFLHVRLFAFDALLLLDGLTTPPLAHYLIGTIANDLDPYVRYHVARALAATVSVAAAKETPAGVGTLGGSGGVEPAWETKRQRIREDAMLAANIWELMNSSNPLDHRIRTELIRFCETVYDSAPEEPPSPIFEAAADEEMLHVPPVFVPAITSSPGSVSTVAASVPTGTVPVRPPAAQSGIQKLKIKMPLKRQVPEPADESSSEDEALPPPPKKKHKSSKLIVPTPKPAVEPTKPAPSVLAKARLPPSAPSSPVAPMVAPADPAFLTRARQILDRLKNHTSAAIFMFPVDPNTPHYYAVITSPMDLSTISKKLAAGTYEGSIDRLTADVRLIFENCFRFNLEGSAPYRRAKDLQAYFETEVLPEAMGMKEQAASPPAPVDEPQAKAVVAKIKVPKPAKPSAAPSPAAPASVATPPSVGPATPATPTAEPRPAVKVKSTLPAAVATPTKLSSEQSRRARKIVKKLVAQPAARWFREPVDPIAQGIPHYFDVIKNPMDLGTVAKKLENGAYLTMDAFDSDIRLIFKNSFTFNSPDSLVCIEAKQLLTMYEKEWKEVGGASGAGMPPIARASTATLSETASSRPVTPAADQPAMAMSADDRAHCDRALRRMEKRAQSVGPFLAPVDRNILPIYYETIKNPMDLGTIRSRLDRGLYTSPDKFASDVRLVFRNCFTFNRPGEPVHVQGKDLEAVFEKEWEGRRRGVERAERAPSPAPVPAADVSKIKLEKKYPRSVDAEPSRSATPKPEHRSPAPTPSLTPAETKLCATVVSKLKRNPQALAFLVPVDPVALQIPTYFDIVKEPMDLGTVGKKLDKGEYSTLNQFARDVRLIFKNCFAFNAPADPVYESGKDLEAQFKKLWSNVETKLGPPAFNDPDRGRSATVSPKPSDAPFPAKKSHSSALSNPATPASSTATPPANAGLCATDTARIRDILVRMRTVPSAVIFLDAVDPVEYPEYRRQIKSPMYIAKMQRRVDRGAYATVADFEADMKLMLKNCFAFNAAGSPGNQAGQALQRWFDKEWTAGRKGKVAAGPASASSSRASSVPVSRAPSRFGEPLRNACHDILDKLVKHPHASTFDKPVSQDILGYHAVISKPMDLGTIRRKLTALEYATHEDFESDVRLIFSNCLKFNGLHSPFTKMAEAIKAIFEREWTAFLGNLAVLGSRNPTPAAATPEAEGSTKRKHKEVKKEKKEKKEKKKKHKKEKKEKDDRESSDASASDTDSRPRHDRHETQTPAAAPMRLKLKITKPSS
ncbi:Bromodomain-containing protein [Blyttiomyces helicus]|uniref:Bromodomain-containing protein n=1 Tax=Blyttiomyces helicus TaxID=388810 RepID=A0A4P9WKW7_9FUNG|nr:Bromodomain-containing protein [Blyttiomyces helicus]|eukprot:RKO92683.1 Bromodomain-containing protein [Blyttiomyces helicus]